MDDFESFDPRSREFQPDELQRARREFRSFYASACTRDMALMDMLVIVRSAVDGSMTAPRSLLSWSDRVELEKTCNENEQAFMHSRNMLQRCASFQSLPLAEQARIAVLVFDVHVNVAD